METERSIPSAATISRPGGSGVGSTLERRSAPGVDPVARWYVVHTQPHCEPRVMDHLRRQEFETFCPSMRKTLRHARTSTIKVVPLFPNYVFVQFDAARKPWRCINGTRGAIRLITNGEIPAPVPLGVVEHIQALTEDGDLVNWGLALKEGDEVRICEGPFAALTGTLERLNAAGRVHVLLDLLGRKVSVCLSGQGVLPAA